MGHYSRRGRTLVALLVPVLLGFGPCGPIAGGALDGEQVDDRISDFRFVNEVNNCALEVSAESPHSVTVNCWTIGKQLFTGCMDCADKTWPGLLNDDPFARVKIADKVYPVKASRITDEIVIQRAWDYRLQKYPDDDEPRQVPIEYGLYHLGSSPRG